MTDVRLIRGDALTVKEETMEYQEFLERKLQLGAAHGFEATYIPDFLFDFQKFLVEWAVKQGRGAILADCGLGKTPMALIWAENVICHTNGRVLILTPLAVGAQMLEEAAKFGVEAHRSRDGKPRPNITIANYEMLHLFDPSDFTGVVCDECFVSDTPIDTPEGTIPISEIKASDMVYTASGPQEVKAITVRYKNSLVLTSIQGRDIISSENHLFFTRRGWVKAKDLQGGDYVIHTTEAMRLVREGIDGETDQDRQQVLRDILLSEMANETTGDSSQSPCAGSASEDRTESGYMAEVWKSEGVGADRTYPATESSARPSGESENIRQVAGNRAQAKDTGRERSRIDCGTTTITDSTGRGLDTGICSEFGQEDSGISDQLQDRHSEQGLNGSHRGRRLQSCGAGKTGEGCQEGCEIAGARVDSVKIYESDDPIFARYRDETGRVALYDLQVANHPSFSVHGLLVHNSSILKSFDGIRRNMITEFLRTIPYRLLSTATAAPNDYVELGTSSEAIGDLGHIDMLNRFFKSNANNSAMRRSFRVKSEWTFKPHAEQSFWRWVCSWARACRRPSDLGFTDDRFILPLLTEHETVVTARIPRPGLLFDLPANGFHEEREVTRRTIQERCEAAASKVNGTGQPAIVWCHLNDEGDLLTKLIPGAQQVSGADSDDSKEEKFAAFKSGQTRVLVTKPKIGAWGLNWEHCAHMVYFPSHCYDSKTEVLTHDGWKTFDLVSLDDSLATVNQETLAMEWQVPSRVIWDNYSGPMLHFYGQRNFDLLVTPNHNLFIQRCPNRYRDDGAWVLCQAGEISERFRRQEFRMLSAPQSADGERPESINIPVHGQHYSRSRTLAPISSADFMRLAGWYLTEGHARPVPGDHAGQIVICQTDHNPEYRTEIIDLLTRIGLPVYTKTKDIRVSNVDLAAFLIDQFGSGSCTKFIPRWVKDLHPDLLTILRDTMMKGDGAATGRYYKSFSSQLRDDFQELCLLTGIRGSVHNDYVSVARQNLRPAIHCEPESIQYDGMIGCATVQNHTLIVRRNGIAVVSGNSYEQYYQAVRRCWRFGQTRKVIVDMIRTDGDINVLANLRRKSVAADKMFSDLVASMNDAMGVKITRVYDKPVKTPSWLS